MSWTANAKITNINSVGAVTVQAIDGGDTGVGSITCTGDDVVTQVDATIKYADASHLKVGDTLTITADC